MRDHILHIELPREKADAQKLANVLREIGLHTRADEVMRSWYFRERMEGRTP